jgi:hypothetical protein
MKIRIPLCKRQVGSHQCPRPEVMIRVQTRYEDFIPLRFIVDAAADLSAIALPLAKQQGLPFRRSNQGVVRGLVGAASKFRDSIHVRIAGVQYEWPCDFVEPPHLPSSISTEPLSTGTADLLPVLGRAGFTAVFDVCIEGNYLILTRPSAFRLWRRRCWRRFWSHFFPDHPVNEPICWFPRNHIS